MTRWTISAFLIATLASFVSLSGSAVSQEGVPAVPYAQVPELKAYIELDVPEPKPDDATVAKVDLDRPPDGVPEYIVSYQSTMFCGSGGCTTEVLRVAPSGKVEKLGDTLGYGFGLAYTATNGMLDLLTVGRDGKFTLKFDGKVYRSHKGQSKAATTKPKDWKAPRNFAAANGDNGGKKTPHGNTAAEQKSPENRGRPKPYIGPTPRASGCVGEYGWRRGYDRKVGHYYGYAVFGHCTDPENMLLKLNCRTDQAGVDVEIEIDPEKAGKLKVAIQVDEAGYLVDADTRYVEMFGYNVPTFRLSPRSPLLNALARGRTASFIVEKKRVKIHLNGASRAIATMRRACRG